MTEFFLKIINMSISASWLVLAVVVLRFMLKKAPKWVGVLLWGIVAVRLLCPFSIESALSLIPSAETVSPEIMTDWTPEIQTGITGMNNTVNPVISETFAPEPWASANPLQILIPVGAVIWLTGVAGMLVYLVISYWQLRRRVATAILVRDHIYQSEYVRSPFVLGMLKPKIYMPFRMETDTFPHVIAHEQAHIRRKDHWWKPIGFLLLAVHWFNPLMWVAYVLLCRDIELACDESVIGELNSREKAAYTQALLDCSVNRRMISACPLAFGEVGVKERVKTVMNYKKPAFWVIVLSVLICGAVAVCFLTNPKEEEKEADVPAASDIQTETTDGANDDNKEVSPLVTSKGYNIGTLTVYRNNEGQIIKKVEDVHNGDVTETNYAYYPNGQEKERAVQNKDGLTITQRREDGSVMFVRQENADCTVNQVYDEAGKLTKSVAEYVSGQRNECFFDEEGRSVFAIITWADGDITTWESSYYANGNMKYTCHNDKGHGIKSETYYNEDGYPASMIIHYEAIPGITLDELSKESIYDADGNVTSKTLYADGKIWETKTDAAGSRVWEKTTHPDGRTDEIFYSKDGNNRYFLNGEEV